MDHKHNLDNFGSKDSRFEILRLKRFVNARGNFLDIFDSNLTESMAFLFPVFVS